MSGFFGDDVVKNEGAGVPWEKEERDKALDDYFEGAHPKKLGIKYKGSPKAFTNSILNKLRYNFKKEGKEHEPGRAERYKIVQRTSRKGKRFTPNEQEFIRCHKELKLGAELTAYILCRDVEELTGATKTEVTKAKVMKEVAPTLDLIWAHRYIFFVYKKPILTDKAYDQLVHEEVEFGGGGPAFAKIKLHNGWPGHIRALALYLVDREKGS